MKNLMEDNWNFEDIEALIASVEENEMLSAPAHMKEEILDKCSRPDTQFVIHAKHTSRQLQLFYYSLKITAGVAAALLLLFSTNFTGLALQAPQKEQKVSITQKLFDTSDRVNQSLNTLTDELLHPVKQP